MRRRVHNWDVLAVIWATEQIGKPFVWGETDCGSLTQAMLEVMYGEDLAPGYRYADLRGALMAVTVSGGVLAVLELLGAVPLQSILYAGTGDVLIAPPADTGNEDAPFERALPVITDRILLTTPRQSVRTAPLLSAPPDAVAYRVPHG